MTATSNILSQTVDIDVNDGTTMGGYVARPSGSGPFPGVVVAMELFGISAHVREVCERLATLGFVALAPDLYVAYLAATEFDLPAVAVVYGGWLPTTEIPLSRPKPTLARTRRITGRLLIIVGEDDQVIPLEHRRDIANALREADVRHEIITYPGVAHGFLSERRAAYNPAAATDTWQRIRALLTAGLSVGPARSDSV